MSFLKLNGGAGVVVVAIALLIASPHRANAETTTLICNADAANVWKDDEPSTIELNEAKSSVALHLAAMTGILRPGDRAPAHASGPLPAIFAADTISFSDQGFNYTLNRLTGSLSRLFGSDVALRWTCHAGKKQF